MRGIRHFGSRRRKPLLKTYMKSDGLEVLDEIIKVRGLEKVLQHICFDRAHADGVKPGLLRLLESDEGIDMMEAAFGDMTDREAYERLFFLLAESKFFWDCTVKLDERVRVVHEVLKGGMMVQDGRNLVFYLELDRAGRDVQIGAAEQLLEQMLPRDRQQVLARAGAG